MRQEKNLCQLKKGGFHACVHARVVKNGLQLINGLLTPEELCLRQTWVRDACSNRARVVVNIHALVAPSEANHPANFVVLNLDPTVGRRDARNLVYV